MANPTDPDIEIGPNQYDIKSTIPQLQSFEATKMMQGENISNIYLG